MMLVGRLCKTHVVSIPLIASGVLSSVFLVWFLFKSYTVMRNGFSHAMWLGSMGLFCGLIGGPDERRVPVKGEGEARCGGAPRPSTE